MEPETDHPGARLPVICGRLLVVLAVLSGCAALPDPGDPEAVAEYEEINDPAEPAMRAIFAINRHLDKALLRPAAVFYKDLTPPLLRDGINNFLNNLRSPLIFLNDLLQGQPERARTTAARFLVNSTVGVLGLGDPASDMGYDRHDEDFGQTLAVWGAAEGPYVMLPVFGPSNPRDAVGLVVDYLVDPFNLWANASNRQGAVLGRAGMQGVDTRAGYYDVLEDLERNSLDYYAAVRSMYRQRRVDEIGNGALPDMAPDLGEDGRLLFPDDEKGDKVSRAE